jgi:dipeptide/tripeptide permease
LLRISDGVDLKVNCASIISRITVTTISKIMPSAAHISAICIGVSSSMILYMCVRRFEPLSAPETENMDTHHDQSCPYALAVFCVVVQITFFLHIIPIGIIDIIHFITHQIYSI